MDGDCSIQAVFKITERCNINCTYCYVFNKGDETYKSNPPFVSKEIIEHTAKFLRKGAKEIGAKKVSIIFHGGEPCLMKKRRFKEMCKILKDEIEKETILNFDMQTNAMLIDEDWIDIISEFNIGVGVSIDGPKSINDRERIDHNGKGTYDRTVAGIAKMSEAYNQGRVKKVGLLAVINPKDSPVEIYRHLVNDLGASFINFLLPIDSHETHNFHDNAAIGKYLCGIFDEWIEANNRHVKVRVLGDTVRSLSGGIEHFNEVKQFSRNNHYIITISSGGAVEGDDTLRQVPLGVYEKNHVATSSFLDLISSEEMTSLLKAEFTLPEDCQDCCWQSVCKGGAANGRLINRFSKKNGFNNKSIVCDSLKEYYSHVAAYLVQNRFTFEELSNNLISEEIEWDAYEEPCPFSR